MKIIITESQYGRIWLLRRYKLVENSFEEAFNIINPCKFKSFDDYERRFVHLMMEELHPEYYFIDDFDYAGVVKELEELFYDEIIDEYRNKIRNC